MRSRPLRHWENPPGLPLYRNSIFRLSSNTRLRQYDSDGFSEFVSVHGKAQLAGNGCFPCQELQRSPWALTSSPAGRLRGVPQPRCSAWKGNSHSLRTAPCCETPRRRCTRQYHVDGVLGAHLNVPVTAIQRNRITALYATGIAVSGGFRILPKSDNRDRWNNRYSATGLEN